jgi:hypothetical protein
MVISLDNNIVQQDLIPIYKLLYIKLFDFSMFLDIFEGFNIGC